MDLRTTEGFLGTGASLLSDISLVAYILLIVPAMLIGFYFARRKMFEPQHKYTMTFIVIFNWVLILWLMTFSYSAGVAPRVPGDLSDIQVWLPTLHLVIGGIAQLLATYLVLRMWLENILPSWLKVNNIKIYMRITLAGWLITALLGVSIYYIWYAAPSIGGADGGSPVVTEEPASTEAADATEPVSTESVSDDLSTTEAEEPVATEAAEDASTDDVSDPVATEEEEAAAPIATEENASESDEPVATEENASESDEPVATEENSAEEPIATEDTQADTEDPATTEEANEPVVTEESN